MRWIVEATNTCWSNYGQLRRNTDGKVVHRHPGLYWATTVLVVGRLLRYRDGPEPLIPYLSLNSKPALAIGHIVSLSCSRRGSLKETCLALATTTVPTGPRGVKHARVEHDRERHGASTGGFGVAVRSHISASSAISTIRSSAARRSVDARCR